MHSYYADFVPFMVHSLHIVQFGVSVRMCVCEMFNRAYFYVL